MLCRTFGGLHRTPLDPAKAHRVLDVGCGTGIWSIDFAKQCPDAEVLGFDLQESPAWSCLPSNCKLRVADLEDAATWSSFDESFDFVYGRMIVVGVKDWPRLFQRCFQALKPGGWMEIQDLRFPIQCSDEQSADASKFVQWSHLMIDAMQKFHLSPQAMDSFPTLMGEVGFQRVTMEDFKMFSGPWSEMEEERELGRMGMMNFSLGLRGFSSTLFTNALGWSAERHEALVQELLQELRDGMYRAYLPIKVCFAQKPE
ncbi:hypothetical protein LTR85_006441 [Meristemomyces frigidus]|nr:hypothetical protein LTR85_006441 [Meristemomyces frigidus]